MKLAKYCIFALKFYFQVMRSHVYGATGSLKQRQLYFPFKMDKNINVRHCSQEEIRNIALFKATLEYILFSFLKALKTCFLFDSTG